MDVFGDVSIVVVAITLVVDKVLSNLRSRGIDLNEMSKQLAELSKIDFDKLEKRTADLHEWHNVSDQEGVKIWYVRRSLEEAIAKLAENIEMETRLLDRIDRRMERIEDQMKE